MNAVHMDALAIRSAAHALDDFWRQMKPCAVTLTGRAREVAEAELVALVLNLAACLSPTEEGEEEAPAAISADATRAAGPCHAIAVLLTLWLERRVTLSAADERLTLRAVQHRRDNLLWQPRAWLRSAEDEREADQSALATLLDATVASVAALALDTCALSSASHATVACDSVAWCVQTAETCLRLLPQSPTRSRDGETTSPLSTALRATFEADAGTAPCETVFSSRPFVASRGLLGALFTLQARAARGMAHWLLDTTIGRHDGIAGPGVVAALVASSGLYAQLLVAASDAATVAYEQFAAPSAVDLRDAIQEELLMGSSVESDNETGDQQAGPALAASDLTHRWIHPAVQMCALRCRVVSGTGLIAADTIDEGACVLAEAPIVAYTRATWPPCGTTAHLSSVVAALAADVQTSLSRPRPSDCPPLLTNPFAQLTVLAARTGVPTTADVSVEAAVEHLVTALLAPHHHLVQPITGLDTFTIGLPCDAELGAEDKHANDWSYLRAVDTGKAIGYLTGLLNHSCSPNTILLSTADGQLLSVVALRTIERGEEITLSYLPSPLLTRAEKEAALGFACQCSFCATRADLLEGIQCGECGRLLRCGGGDGAHAMDCPARHMPFAQWHDAVLLPLTRQIACAEALAVGVPGDGPVEEVPESDGYTESVRALVALDEQLGTQASPLLPVHYLRLRMREHLLAIAVVASGLTLTLSESLQRIAAELLESMALLLPDKTPFLTDLRMHHVFVRARHLHDALLAEEAADADPTLGHGDDCCGAVRHEAMVLRKPYVRDAVVRHGVIRSFQEHHLQCCGWRHQVPALAPCDPLTSFFERFPVELSAAGVEVVDDLELLACMDDGERATSMGL